MGISPPNLTFMYKWLAIEDCRTLPKNVLFFADLGLNTMDNQIEIYKIWVRELEPKMCIFNIYVDKNKKYTEFYEGRLLSSPWNKQLSNAIKIETPAKKIIKYDNLELLERRFYHDIYVSSTYHHHNVSTEPHPYQGITNMDGNTLDHCHSCWREIEMTKKLGKDPKKTMLNLIYKFDKPELKRHFLEIRPHSFFPEMKNSYKRLRHLEAYCLLNLMYVDLFMIERRKIAEKNKVKYYYSVEEVLNLL